ncbi:MAG: hypothetical protein ACFB5Z_13870 [Elainellaceae cyanobacterium]
MTFLYPEQPLGPEAALLRLDIAPPAPGGEVVRHIIIGSPPAIRETIHLMHINRYAVEQSLWTGPVAIGPDGVRLSQREGQALAYLMRIRSL